MCETVIIVDDDPCILEIVSRLVEKLGYQPTKCNDSRDVLRETRLNPRSILLSDYSMPGLNGIESLRALRNENELIPCIILTGDAYLIDRSEAQDLGVVAILEKPAKFDELEAALLKACLELNACTEATLAFPNSEPEVV